MTRPDPLAAPPPLAALHTGPMPARIGRVRIGTASWTEKTLLESGAFYPPAVRTPEQRLRYYARHFPVVEVDSTYYALPQARVAAAWVVRTPPDFRFGVKAFAPLTGHPVERARLDRDLQASLPRKARLAPGELPPEVLDAVWARFRAAIEPLRTSGKLAYVLFQMPPWFTPTQANRAYLEAVRTRLTDVPLAVEFRQKDWMIESRATRVLDFLRAHAMAYVCVDEPQGTRASVPPVVAVTAPALAVVRFHGRRRETWDRPGVGTSERFGYCYTTTELAEWVPAVRALAGEAREVCVLMNNCHREWAVQNAKELAVLLMEAG